MQTLIERADAFAMRAHASIGRLRRYTGMPQIAHAREVAQLVRDVGGDDAMIAAALLHDVRDEVLSISRVQILLEFGTDVDRLVDEITDMSEMRDGNRARRKAIYREHLSRASARAQTIKLADIISDARSVVERDPDFAQVHLPELASFLRVLTRGDAGLYEQAARLVEQGLRTVVPFAA